MPLVAVAELNRELPTPTAVPCGRNDLHTPAEGLIGAEAEARVDTPKVAGCSELQNYIVRRYLMGINKKMQSTDMKIK